MLEAKIDELTKTIDRLIAVMSAQPAAATLPDLPGEKPWETKTKTEEKPKKRGRGRPPKSESVESQPKVEPTKEAVEDTPVEDKKEADDDDFALDEEEQVEVEVTADVLRAALKELRDVDKGKIASLMKKYKAKAFSDLDEADYGVIHAEAKALKHALRVAKLFLHVPKISVVVSGHQSVSPFAHASHADFPSAVQGPSVPHSAQ